MKFPEDFKYYGGLNDLSRAIKVDRSTVGYWKRADKVSRKHEKAVMQAVYKLRSERAETEKIMDRVRTELPPVAEPEPVIEKVRLSDIVDMIADYMRERGL